MEITVIVAEHALKHGLQENDIRYAWDNFLCKQHRRAPNEDQILAVGYDDKGRPYQMVAIAKPFGILIYHAMTPPTRNALAELGLTRRR